MKTIAIDQNISNFFVAADSDGNLFQLNNLSMIKYLDEKIDQAKSYRDACDFKSKKYTKDYTDNIFYQPSNEWLKRNEVIHKLYRKRNAQLNQALYQIANYLTDRYDVIAIGDYSVDLKDIPNKVMRRKMIDQTCTARFRLCLQHVCDKKNKTLIIVNEAFTTQDCFNCNDRVVKSPDIRKFRCDKCGLVINRDVNSAINIGLRAGIFKKDPFIGKDLIHPIVYEYKLHEQNFHKVLN